MQQEHEKIIPPNLKIFPLKNSPIEIQAARNRLINFVSQKIVGIIKLGDAKISIKKGRQKSNMLNEDNSGLYSKA